MQQIIGKISYKCFLLVLFFVGLIWLRSSWGKLSAGTFVNGLGATLTKFAEKNPYPWYKDFLHNFAIPNSTMFGLLTMWGEFAVAIALIVSCLYLIFMPFRKVVLLFLALGVAGGLFLNTTFWLAAGYTSASTDSLNLLMMAIEAVGLVFAAITLSRSRK